MHKRKPLSLSWARKFKEIMKEKAGTTMAIMVPKEKAVSILATFEDYCYSEEHDLTERMSKSDIPLIITGASINE